MRNRVRIGLCRATLENLESVSQALRNISAIFDQEIDELVHSRHYKAAALYQDRRKRGGAFEELDLFGEPAWDILLDAYCAERNDTGVSVSSACIASSVPATTALRHIAKLHGAGLLDRHIDPTDGRRVHVRLTQDGRERMERYLDLI